MPSLETTKEITTKSQEEKRSVSEHASGDKRFKTLDLTMKRNHYSQDALIEVLHRAQEAFGYLEEDVLMYVARGLKLPLSRVYGVATFYHLFSLKPQGEHACIVCMGTACYVKGASALLEAIDREIGIHPGETTADRKVSLLTARCIGACGIAPATVLDGQVYGKQSPENVLANIRNWLH
jgi:bidirectional [NiFe] hydrogenase diaphorase subunit